MDTGQIIYILSQLILGAVVAFLAISLLPKTRDAAWLLIIFGAIIAYIETVYSILKTLGIAPQELIILGSIPLISLILCSARMIFFIAGFATMLYKQSKKK